jgi:hypothetical protein
MNIQTLRMLILSQAVCLAPAALAAVTINGESFTSFKMSSTATGGVTLTTVPPAVVVDPVTNLPVAIPELTPDYSVSVAGLTGEITITLPDEIQPVNCTLPDSTVNNPIACPAVAPPPPPGQCGTIGAELVYETLNWVKQPGTTKISLGKKVKASKFVTTSSRLYAGAVAVVPTTATGYVTRRVWISTCPGTEPLDQTYSKTVTKSDGTRTKVSVNKCDVSGTQLQLNWSQEVTPGSVTVCKLDPSTEYYLNYSNANCSTNDCSLYRSTGNNGKP